MTAPNTAPYFRSTTDEQRIDIATVAQSIATARSLLDELRSQYEERLLTIAAQHADNDHKLPGAAARGRSLAERAQTLRWLLGRIDAAADTLSGEYNRVVRGLRP